MVLGYLAYETLGRLVELCLLVRRDAARLFPFVLSQISRFEGQHSVRITDWFKLEPWNFYRDPVTRLSSPLVVEPAYPTVQVRSLIRYLNLRQGCPLATSAVKTWKVPQINIWPNITAAIMRRNCRNISPHFAPTILVICVNDISRRNQSC